MVTGPLTWVSRLFTDSDEDDPAARCGAVSGRLPSPAPDSEHSFRVISHWIENCVANHPECASIQDSISPETTQPQPLPTRVLDVGPPDGAQITRLLETKGRPGSYIAMSHSWGGIITLVTEEKSLVERKKGIEPSTLPRSFRDAIHITRKLGIRYLWIDSLCIIQDSAIDWEIEASRMSEVYKNALLTIAATGAENSLAGCFMKRPISSMAPIQLELTLDGGQISQVYLWPSSCKPIDPFRVEVDMGPLSKRAWVLQERILSRRTLHYGKTQILWECQQESLAEDGSRGAHVPVLRSSFTIRKLERTSVSSSDIRKLPSSQTEFSSGDIRKSLGDSWIGVVQLYTRRQLTRGTDKLPALSGLAHEFYKYSGDDYLAGLWRTGLEGHLCWSVEPFHLRYGWTHRPSAYRAPTWSWASLDGEIKFIWPSKDTFPLEIIEADTTVLGQDPFGQVKGGWIKVSGLLYHATSSEETEIPGCERLRILHNQAGERVGSVVYDIDHTMPGPVACLPYSKSRQGGDYISHVIILRRTGQSSDEYQRIGIGKLHHSVVDESLKEIFTVI